MDIRVVSINEARAASALTACIFTIEECAKKAYAKPEDYAGYLEARTVRDSILCLSTSFTKPTEPQGPQITDQGASERSSEGAVNES